MPGMPANPKNTAMEDWSGTDTAFVAQPRVRASHGLFTKLETVVGIQCAVSTA
jgi:hypothetical protein